MTVSSPMDTPDGHGFSADQRRVRTDRRLELTARGLVDIVPEPPSGAVCCLAEKEPRSRGVAGLVGVDHVTRGVEDEQ